ncbi:MAG: WecB/TagA/CpsF family glycosyltransferase [Chloroflexota bacterium]|nr:WecB/TagA/CpsF family glycosyltransferase [Chloroflexota bacterium]
MTQACAFSGGSYDLARGSVSAHAGAELPVREVLGVAVHPLSMAAVLQTLDRFLADRRPHQVVTVNAEFVVRARRDRAFRQVLGASDLATVDGTLVALALRYLQRVPAQRVTGADLLPQLARLAAKRACPVFLLGAGPGVAEAAAERLRLLAPGLNIAGTYAGSAHPDEDERICAMIRLGGARVLLVAYGAPTQDLWIARNLQRLGPCVAIGVGGSFDYLAGVTPRAPLWMRWAGMEWLYRLVRQPSRWRRQLALPLFVYLAVRDIVVRQASQIRVDKG